MSLLSLLPPALMPLSFQRPIFTVIWITCSLSMSTCHLQAQEPQVQPPALEDGFVWLFDGMTLEGWEGNHDLFRIEQAAIVAGTLKRDIPNNEFLCTQKEYGDFELRLEVKLQGEGDNAGVQFRSTRIAGDHEVSGYQCDVGSAWDRPVWGGLYDESRRNKMLAEGPADQLPQWVKEGEWNELTIRAVGGWIGVSHSGMATIEHVHYDVKNALRGIIGLQIHAGPPTEAWYRRIRIHEIER